MSAPQFQRVICLSDSEESVRSARNEDDNDEADFNFPSVNFTYHDVNDARDTNDKPNEEVNETSPRFDRAGSSRLNELLGKYSNDREDTRQADGNNKKTNSKTQRISAEPDFLDEDGKPADTNNYCKTRSERKETEESNLIKKTRAMQIPRNKSPTLVERLYRKNMQPGECLKSVRVSIDKGLTKFGFHSALHDVLRDSDVSCELDSLPIENSIIWIRKVEYTNEIEEISSETERSVENEIVVVWNWEETVRRVGDGSFASSVENVATLMSDKRVMLVLYGMAEYFRYQKNLTKQRSKNGASAPFAGLPNISKQDLEICLTEVQLIVNCNSILVDTSQEMSTLVYRLTKAIAEKPFKLEKRQRLEEKVDWYAMGDNRDTVRVDKNGNGLKRLWLQQLRQFNLATLETSEAISSVYPSPFKLMQAYGNCTSAEGEGLLSEIPIRRAAGPLSTIRKIGPELSKKIFITFTSKDGDTLINERELQRAGKISQ